MKLLNWPWKENGGNILVVRVSKYQYQNNKNNLSKVDSVGFLANVKWIV